MFEKKIYTIFAKKEIKYNTKTSTMKKEAINKLLKRYGIMFVAIIIGAIAGYAYWYHVGCTSGTCPITSSPTTSTIWGAIMGGLLFVPNKSKTT